MTRHLLTRDESGRAVWVPRDQAPPAAGPPVVRTERYEHVCHQMRYDPEVHPHRVRSGRYAGKGAFQTRAEIERAEAVLARRGLDIRWKGRDD